MRSQYTQEELNKIHSIELDLLEEFIRICKICNISYTTHGGTTLGAIRHSGFIPWDDDIDIALLRKDYEKFVKMAPSLLRDGYVFQHFSVEKNAPTYFAKVRKEGTLFIEQGEENVNMHHGVFIDIFPLDNIQNDIGLIKKYKLKNKIIRQFFIHKLFWMAPLYKGVRIKYIIGNFIRIIIHIITIPIKRKILFKWLDENTQKYNNHPTGYITTELLGAVNINDIFPTRTQRFESLTVQVPKNAELVLKMMYGNYMQMPPVEQRIGHRPVKLKVE